MTLDALLEQSRSAPPDTLLTLQEVALITDTSMRTLRAWTSGAKPALAHEHVGPAGRVRVRLSVVVRFFPRDTLHLERLRRRRE